MLLVLEKLTEVLLLWEELGEVLLVLLEGLPSILLIMEGLPKVLEGFQVEAHTGLLPTHPHWFLDLVQLLLHLDQAHLHWYRHQLLGGVWLEAHTQKPA